MLRRDNEPCFFSLLWQQCASAQNNHRFGGKPKNWGEMLKFSSIERVWRRRVEGKKEGNMEWWRERVQSSRCGVQVHDAFRDRWTLHCIALWHFSRRDGSLSSQQGISLHKCYSGRRFRQPTPPFGPSHLTRTPPGPAQVRWRGSKWPLSQVHLWHGPGGGGWRHWGGGAKREGAGQRAADGVRRAAKLSAASLIIQAKSQSDCGGSAGVLWIV